MAASRTHADPKSPAAATFKGNSHGAAAPAARTRPPSLSRRPGRRPQQHQQRYFGRMASNVTDHLKKVVPTHSFHPSLLPLPAPAFHRKASSISAYIECQVRPPPQPRRPYTAPDVYFGRRASNVTDHLRYIPPSHLGLDAQSKSLPYFGRLATSVTDPSKYMEAGNGDGDCVDNIMSHWSAGSRPSSARLPVAPQHVSKEVLYHALSARGDHSCSGRRPTNIGSLLKHQFSHLLGDPDVHAEHEQKMTLPNTSPKPDCDHQAPLEPRKIKNHSGGGRGGSAVCSPRPANKPVDEYSAGQISTYAAAAQRPRTAPVAEKNTKRTHDGSNTNNNTQHHFPSPRILASPRQAAASPRPASERSYMGEKCAPKLSAHVSKQGEAWTPRRKGHEETEKSRVQENKRDEAAWGDDADMNEDEEEMTENGEQMTAGGVGQCDDNSSEVSEKVELVRQWVQQEEAPHFLHKAAWPPKPLHKVVDHSRRATSITKYNIW